MRLTDQQIQGLINALNPFIKNAKAELRLYGSRTQDHLKGGDIDLLLIVTDTQIAENLAQEKHRLLSAMKQQIGDQKIDFKITTPQQCQEDSFLKIILPNSLILFCWD